MRLSGKDRARKRERESWRVGDLKFSSVGGEVCVINAQTGTCPGDGCHRTGSPKRGY